MKVLHVISGVDPRSGGPAMALSGLAPAQVAAGLKVAVISGFRKGADHSMVDRLRSGGVDVRLVGPCEGPLSRHSELSANVAEMVAAADVVHIHALWEEIQHQAARAAQRRGTPYIVRPCGMLDPWSTAQSRWRKRLYMLWRLGRNLRHASALHYTTEMERRNVESSGMSCRAIVEPNGVDLHEFEHLPPRGTFRARYPVLGSSPYVVYLGRLHPGKGLELLIPAFAQIRDPDVKLVLVGPDSENFRARVERIVGEHQLQERVVFAGLLRGADRIAALAEAVLFALPSYHENFGIAVIEALAAGIPVIVSDHVYIHEEISREGVGGVVPLQIDALAQELARWLGDEPLRRQAAQRARAYAMHAFDWHRIASRWVGHYVAL